MTQFCLSLTRIKFRLKNCRNVSLRLLSTKTTLYRVSLRGSAINYQLFKEHLVFFALASSFTTFPLWPSDNRESPEPDAPDHSLLLGNPLGSPATALLALPLYLVSSPLPSLVASSFGRPFRFGSAKVIDVSTLSK